MNILVILGSPKRGGQTSQIVDQYLEPFIRENYQVERVFLRNMKISPCIACDCCQENGLCVIQDDMQAIYQMITKANMVIMASPIYFNSVSAWMKIMIDRCQVYWSKKFVLNDRKKTKDKLGVFLCTAGVAHVEDSLVGATKVMDLFFKSIDAEFVDSLCIDQTDSFPVQAQTEKLKDLKIKATKHIALLKQKHEI